MCVSHQVFQPPEGSIVPARVAVEEMVLLVHWEVAVEAIYIHNTHHHAHTHTNRNPLKHTQPPCGVTHYIMGQWSLFRKRETYWVLSDHS